MKGVHVEVIDFLLTTQQDMMHVSFHFYMILTQYE